MPRAESVPELRLRSYHEVSGALFRKEAEWEVPAGYGPLDSEVNAVRRTVGSIDFSDRAKVAVRGSDRVTFLDGLVTADVKTLRPGMSAYALVLDEVSHVLGDLRVSALDDIFVMDIEAAQKDFLLEYLRKQVVSDEVVFEDRGFCGHIEVHGPRAPDAVSAVVGVDVRGLSVGEHTTFPLNRHRTGYVSRVNTFGEAGYAVWALGDDLDVAWESLVRTGVTPVGRDAFDVLRIEAGRPRFGLDMTEENLALEVAPEGSIDFSKGCYKGQEVVARGASIGRVGRRLFGLRVDGDVPPSRGDAVRVEGEDAGFVTSGCWSPTTGWIVALSLLRVDKVRTDSQFFIDHAGWDLRASWHPLPFVLGRA